MVVEQHFDFQIVSTDNNENGVKIPFMEHSNNGKTYVEVEPDAEYFLSVRQIRPSSTELYSEFSVDGKNLGFHVLWPGGLSVDPVFLGIVSNTDGIETTKALKFVSATFTTDDNKTGSIPSSMAGMGQIQMIVSHGIFQGIERRRNFAVATSFEASSIDIDCNNSDAFVTKKKNLRSGVGSTAIVSAKKEGEEYYRSYEKGHHLYTITLCYCATPGLIAVGVLPKPPHWTYARMIHPAKTTTEEKKKIKKGIISEKFNETGTAVLELDDDDDDDDDVRDGNNTNTNNDDNDTNNKRKSMKENKNNKDDSEPQPKKSKSNPITI